MKYVAHFFFDGDGIGVEFPDVPGAYTCADSIEDAPRAAREALNGVLKTMLDRGEKLPEAKTKADWRDCMHAIEVDEDIARVVEDGR